METANRQANVRVGLESDAEAIARIYNQGIEERVGTFETRLRTSQDVQKWFVPIYPIVVVEEANEVVAFASTSLYRQRDCYLRIAEFSVYVDPAHRGKGYGSMAMTELISQAKAAGYYKLVSRIIVGNEASRSLMRSLGFREVGIYEKHGNLDGQWRDVVIVEKLIQVD